MIDAYGNQTEVKYNIINTNQDGSILVTRVTLDKTSIDLLKGQSASIIASIAPANAGNKNIIWESDNTKVATVDSSGKVIAVGAGTATITVRSEDGNKTATCKITVTELNGWIKKNNKWYYYENGQSIKAWKNINNTWYYFNDDESMASGWVKSAGKWYFMDDSGAMKTEWILSDGKWYFMNSSGEMATGWISSGSKWYYMDSSGSMSIGWLKLNNKWYYLEQSGAMKTGWIELSGKWYYLYSSGEMASSTTINGYKLGSDGAWID